MLSSYDLTIYSLIAVTIAVYGYTIYVTLSMRRKIAGSIYRRQALGLALVALLYGLNSANPNFNGPATDIYSIFNTLVFQLSFLMIFFWVDTSVMAARLSDPLLRDTLRWSRVRIVIWAVNILASVFPWAYEVYLEYGTGGLPPSPPVFLLAIFLTPAYLSVSAGAIVLLKEVRRTGDRTLRRHLEWFGIFLIFIFVLGGLIGNGLSLFSTQWGNIVGGTSNAAAAFFLYRSAKSLIPIYSFPNEGSQSATKMPSSGIAQNGLRLVKKA